MIIDFQIDEIWDKLEDGMEVEHNGDAGSRSTSFRKGKIRNLKGDRFELDMNGSSYDGWVVNRSSKCTIRIDDSFLIGFSPYEASFVGIEQGIRGKVRYAKDQEELRKIFIEDRSSPVKIFKLVEVTPRIKIEEI